MTNNEIRALRELLAETPWSEVWPHSTVAEVRHQLPALLDEVDRLKKVTSEAVQDPLYAHRLQIAARDIERLRAALETIHASCLGCKCMEKARAALAGS